MLQSVQHKIFHIVYKLLHQGHGESSKVSPEGLARHKALHKIPFHMLIPKPYSPNTLSQVKSNYC